MVYYTTKFSHCLNHIYIHSLCQLTPLHMAAREGYVNTVKLLVESEADTSIKYNNGVRTCTSLHCKVKIEFALFPGICKYHCLCKHT